MAQNTSSQMAAPTDDSLQQQLSKANDFASKGELTQATDLYVQMLGLAPVSYTHLSDNQILNDFIFASEFLKEIRRGATNPK